MAARLRRLRARGERHGHGRCCCRRERAKVLVATPLRLVRHELARFRPVDRDARVAGPAVRRTAQHQTRGRMRGRDGCTLSCCRSEKRSPDPAPARIARPRCGDGLRGLRRAPGAAPRQPRHLRKARAHRCTALRTGRRARTETPDAGATAARCAVWSLAARQGEQLDVVAKADDALEPRHAYAVEQGMRQFRNYANT